MSDLGALLRKAREHRGYTLDDVQELTKIRKRYLEAIETGEYKVLPGSFYVRAFVKTYAETVGLDAEEVLRLYQKELPKSASIDIGTVDQRMKPKRRSVQHNDRWGKVAVSLLMWAFPILIAAVIYIYLQYNKESDAEELSTPPPITSETATPTPEVSATPMPTPTPTPTPPPQVKIELTETQAGKQFYTVTGGQKIEIEVTGYVWLGVYPGSVAKGKGFYNKTITDNDVKVAPVSLEYPLDQQLYVNAGRADRISIKIDGVPFDDGDKPTPGRFVFTPAGLGTQGE